MRATFLERRLFLPLAAFALLGLAATGGTLVARQASAQAADTSTACAAEGPDTNVEVADTQDSDAVDLQCGDQTEADGPEIDERGGVDTDQIQGGDQKARD